MNKKNFNNLEEDGGGEVMKYFAILQGGTIIKFSENKNGIFFNGRIMTSPNSGIAFTELDATGYHSIIAQGKLLFNEDDIRFFQQENPIMNER